MGCYFDPPRSSARSDRVSGWSAQLSEQIQILAELSKLIKALKYTGSLKASPKIALLGHSFGSAITHGVTTYDPTLMDAVILTGYGMNSTAFNFNLVEAGWSLRVADEEHNFKDAGFDAGYITWDDVWTNILVLVICPGEVSSNQMKYRAKICEQFLQRRQL